MFKIKTESQDYKLAIYGEWLQNNKKEEEKDKNQRIYKYIYLYVCMYCKFGLHSDVREAN